MPLYTAKDAEQTLDKFASHGYGEEFEVAPGIHATFLDAGHILGSAIIRLRVQDGPDDEERILVCSGDLGRPGTPILRDPTVMTDADYVLVESTGGASTSQDEAIRIRPRRSGWSPRPRACCSSRRSPSAGRRRSSGSSIG
jgi:metallo-beta-lactamase family protein